MDGSTLAIFNGTVMYAYYPVCNINLDIQVFGE